jgi:hypothetical protein
MKAELGRAAMHDVIEKIEARSPSAPATELSPSFPFQLRPLSQERSSHTSSFGPPLSMLAQPIPSG